jgi:glucosylceramidase
MIIADASVQQVYPQIFYWYVGHFSRYVQRGSYRVGIDVGPSSPVEAVAFQNPNGEVVVVVMNAGDESISFVLQDVILNVQTEVLALPPHSIQTLLYTP